MRRYLLDTGIAADYVNRRLGVYEQARMAVADGDRIGIGIPVLGELWAGIELSKTRSRNETSLVHNLGDFIVWPFDQRAARQYGVLFAELRRRGRKMQQVDMQIAAIAISLGDCTVVTKDSDLAAVPKLSVIDWSRS